MNYLIVKNRNHALGNFLKVLHELKETYDNSGYAYALYACLLFDSTLKISNTIVGIQVPNLYLDETCIELHCAQKNINKNTDFENGFQIFFSDKSEFDSSLRTYFRKEFEKKDCDDWEVYHYEYNHEYRHNELDFTHFLKEEEYTFGPKFIDLRTMDLSETALLYGLPWAFDFNSYIKNEEVKNVIL